jgi:hypothetical protein
MATSPNATQITPPRVPIIDERTGAVSREWYRWFYSLYNFAGEGTGILAIANGGTNGSATPTTNGVAYGTGMAYAFTAAGTTGQVLTATTSGAPTWATPAGVAAPVIKTANFTVADTEVWLINNKSGSTCTVTLPAASSWTGRVLRFQNYQVQAVVSASSNVVPLTGGAAATSILLASSGDSATLVSNGTNWLMTQYIPNNILLLE